MKKHSKSGTLAVTKKAKRKRKAKWFLSGSGPGYEWSLGEARPGRGLPGFVRRLRGGDGDHALIHRIVCLLNADDAAKARRKAKGKKT